MLTRGWPVRNHVRGLGSGVRLRSHLKNYLLYSKIFLSLPELSTLPSGVAAEETMKNEPYTASGRPHGEAADHMAVPTPPQFEIIVQPPWSLLEHRQYLLP